MKKKFKKHYSRVKNIIGSATFGLFITVLFFMYEMNENTNETEKIVENLTEIQSSLSTRYLGIFPEYLDGINELLKEADEHQKVQNKPDSIIICEDVLYYGIRSDMHGFQSMIKNLTSLAKHGTNITIAFYDINGQPFKQMIKNGLISSLYQSKYSSDMAIYRERLNSLRENRMRFSKNLTREDLDLKMDSLINTYFDNYLENNKKGNSEMHIHNLMSYQYIDSMLIEKYYKLSRNANPQKFSNKIKALLRPLPQLKDASNETAIELNELFSGLDSVAKYHLQKTMEDISYSDIEKMYKGYSTLIFNYLKKLPNIELIPLREDIAMCCWMSIIDKECKAIIAFPSKYSTDEMGFISQDEAFSKYIQTMLSGIKMTHQIYSKDDTKFVSKRKIQINNKSQN